MFVLLGTVVRLHFDGETPGRLADALRRLRSVPAAKQLIIRNARLTESDLRELVQIPRLSLLAVHDSAAAGSWEWLEQLDGLMCRLGPPGE